MKINNALSYPIAIGIPQLFTFGTLLLFVNQLSSFAYAKIAIYETIFFLSFAVNSMGMEKSTARFHLDYDASEVVSQNSGLSIISIIFFCPLFIIFNFLAGSPVNIFDLLVVYFSAGSTALLRIALVKYQFSKEIWNYLLAGLVKTIPIFVSAVFFIYIFSLQEESFIYANLIFLIIAFIYTHKILKPKIFINKFLERAKEYILFSYPFVISALAGWSVTWSNRLFMDEYLSEYELGLFSQIFRLSMIFYLITSSINLYFVPKFLLFLDKDKNSSLIKNILIIYVIYFVASSFLLFISLILFRDLFSQEVYSLIIIAVIAVNFLNALPELSSRMYLQYYKKTNLQMIAACVGGFVALSLNYTLIPDFGLQGVLIALCVSCISIIVVENIFVIYVLKIYTLPLIVLLSSITIFMLILFLLIF